MKINTVLDKIDDKQLFVPAFQREYVWKRDDAKQLIESLIKDYPTGTMLTWETSNPPELKGPHKYHENQGAVKLILDGQQRITTLYMLIRGETPPYYTLPEIIRDTRGLHVNLETLELSYYMKTKMEKNPYWQNITDIFQEKVDAFGLQSQFAAAGKELNMAELKAVNENIQAIVDILKRDFPEQTIPIRASIKEAIDIFYKVNASGVALTDAELALAQISGYWPEVRDLLKQKITTLARQGFVFKLDFMVYALLACMHNLGSDMKRLHGAENLDAVTDEDGNVVRQGIKDVWATLDKYVLDYVMNLLRSKAYVDHTQEVNSIYAFIPIIAFCYRKHGSAIPEKQLWRIVKWFYYSQVRKRYISQLSQKLDFDLRIVAGSDMPFEELLGVIAEERRLEIAPGELEGRSVSHPLFGLTRWFFKSQDATCLTTGLGLHANMGEKYKLENDHIFPWAILKKNGYDKSNRLKFALAQEFTNRAILTKLANGRKSAKPAADYLADVKVNSPGTLEKQCIPTDENLWQVENYEAFLAARRELLAENLNSFLDGLASEEEAHYGEATLEERVAEGESADMEFKSSLRWDYREGRVNKVLENVIVKTVAAFANSEGGTLLIGVNDDGEAVGLDHDYASLSADKDKFELHLRNLLHKQMGKPFVSGSVKTYFPNVSGTEICQIEIAAANDPVFLSVTDKAGEKAEKLYVRSGCSSQEFSLSEFNEYRKERFS